MNLLLGFISGMFLTNGMPHFVSGIMGKSHMTPFGKDSSAITNIVWGYINFLVGFWLLNVSGGSLAQLRTFDSYAISFWIGSFVIALSGGWLFSKPNASFPWFKK